MPPPIPIETQPKLEFVQLSRDGDFALFEQAGKDGLKVNRREYSLVSIGVCLALLYILCNSARITFVFVPNL
jgi:hypothetical protein